MFKLPRNKNGERNKNIKSIIEKKYTNIENDKVPQAIAQVFDGPEKICYYVDKVVPNAFLKLESINFAGNSILGLYFSHHSLKI